MGKLLLESVLIAHTSDILLDKLDTIMDCGRSDLYLPLGPHIRIKKMWRLSVFDSDSPDFPDMGDTDFCFGMPRLPNSIGNVELDVDTALLARGELFPDSDGPVLSARICSDVARPPGLEGLAGSGGVWLYKAGSCQCVAIS